jgi:DNA-3-methyladenine glycosylase
MVPPGYAYVYFIYGQHYCLNVVTEREGFPAAILIRALEPEEGLDWIARRRRGIPMRDWLRGPGRVCAGLGIDRRFNGHDLCAPDARLWLEAGEPVPEEQVATSPASGCGGMFWPAPGPGASTSGIIPACPGDRPPGSGLDDPLALHPQVPVERS